MKTLLFIFLLSFFFIGYTCAQDPHQNDNSLTSVFSLGLGVGSENNIGHWGVFVSNELKTELNSNLSLNPRLSYFETIAIAQEESIKGFSSHSGLFIDFGLSYAFFKKKNDAFSLSAGPSYQIGNQTHTKVRSFAGNTLISEQFEHSRINRLGLYVDLAYSWNMESKYQHSIALKSYSFDIYPEFLGLVYKIGFKLE